LGSTGFEGDFEGAGFAAWWGEGDSGGADGGEGVDDGAVELGISGAANEFIGLEASAGGDGELYDDFAVGEEAFGGLFPFSVEEGVKLLEVAVHVRLRNDGSGGGDGGAGGFDLCSGGKVDFDLWGFDRGGGGTGCCLFNGGGPFFGSWSYFFDGFGWVFFDFLFGLGFGGGFVDQFFLNDWFWLRFRFGFWLRFGRRWRFFNGFRFLYFGLGRGWWGLCFRLDFRQVQWFGSGWGSTDEFEEVFGWFFLFGNGQESGTH